MMGQPKAQDVGLGGSQAGQSGPLGPPSSGKGQSQVLLALCHSAELFHAWGEGWGHLSEVRVWEGAQRSHEVWGQLSCSAVQRGTESTFPESVKGGLAQHYP